MNYFLIPGNPPALYFYELWAQEIRDLKGGAKVVVSSYPLLSKMNDSHKAMDYVFSEHLNQLNSFQDEVKSPIIIIGHSLGSYFALKLLEQRSEFINHVVLIHPFLKKPSLQGQLILKMAGSIYHSSFLQRGILSNRKKMEVLSNDLSYVTNEEILNSFHIARHEGLTIGVNKKKLEIHPTLQSKVVVFYTQDDIWCGKESVEELKSLVRVIECEEPHGFITHEKHRKTLFTKINLKPI